jgi:PhnB protein
VQRGSAELESVSLSLALPDEGAARRYFDALARDCEVRMPVGRTFFSPCFGAVKDKFGLGWMVIVEPDEMVA